LEQGTTEGTSTCGGHNTGKDTPTPLSSCPVTTLEENMINWLEKTRKELEQGLRTAGTDGYLLQFSMSDVSRQVNKFLKEALNSINLDSQGGQWHASGQSEVSQQSLQKEEERKIILGSWVTLWGKRLHESLYNDSKDTTSLEQLEWIPNANKIKVSLFRSVSNLGNCKLFLHQSPLTEKWGGWKSSETWRNNWTIGLIISYMSHFKVRL